MKRSSNSYHIVLAIIVTAICIYFSTKTLVPKYKTDRTNLSQVQAELKAINAKLASLQSAKQSLDDLGDIVDKMLVAVPKDKDAPNLLTELEAMAIKYRTYIPSIQIADDSSDDLTLTSAAMNTIPVAFTVNGSFSDLNQFIQALEKDIRFMNIKSVTLSSVGGSVSMSVQLDAYKRNDNAISSSSLFTDVNTITNSSTEVTQ